MLCHCRRNCKPRSRILSDRAGKSNRYAGAIEAFGKDFEARVVETVGAVLSRMNVPTRDDIESLKKSVDRLNKKAAALRTA